MTVYSAAETGATFTFSLCMRPQFENSSLSVAAALTGMKKLDASILFQRKNDAVFPQSLFWLLAKVQGRWRRCDDQDFSFPNNMVVCCLTVYIWLSFYRCYNVIAAVCPAEVVSSDFSGFSLENYTRKDYLKAIPVFLQSSLQ